MTDSELQLRRRALPRLGALLTAASLTLGLGATSAAAKPTRTRAAAAQSRLVLACMRHGHLSSVGASASYLWVGWDAAVGGFVYVQKYPNLAAAREEVKFLSDEEAGLAGNLVVSEHIAPFKGSPVPAVVKCLGGQMYSKQPTKGGGVFKF